MELTLIHLYPDLMNLYGSYANLSVLPCWSVIRRPRSSMALPAKSMGRPASAASCAVRPQPRIQAICLRHISTCPQ